MMTNGQVQNIVNDIRIHSDYPWKQNLNSLEAHDAEQRERIALQEKQLFQSNQTNEYLASTIRKWEQICMEQRQRIEELEKKTCWLTERDEVAKWYETLVSRAKIGTAQTPSLRAYIEQLEQQNAALREALQALYDCQNGCPLPKYQVDWDRAMELTRQALKEHT